LVILIYSNLYMQPQTANEALTYMNSITARYEAISNDSWAYVKAAAHNKFAIVAENKRKALIKTVKTALSEVEKSSTI